MMIQFEHLEGIPFVHGTTDCYDLIRRFYADNFKIELPNFARPDGWWNQGMNLYGDLYHEAGFRVLDCHPSEYQTGDVVLMAVLATVANHGGVLLPDGRLLHHLHGRLSLAEAYSTQWRARTLYVLRHKDIPENLAQQTEVDIRDVLPPLLRKRLDARLGVPTGG